MKEDDINTLHDLFDEEGAPTGQAYAHKELMEYLWEGDHLGSDERLLHTWAKRAVKGEVVSKAKIDECISSISILHGMGSLRGREVGKEEL